MLYALVPHRDSNIFEALRDRSAAYAGQHGHAPRVAVPTLDVPRAADRRIDAVNILTVAGIDGVDSDTDAGASLIATDKGYEGVAKDMDVVAFLGALLDEVGAPA